MEALNNLGISINHNIEHYSDDDIGITITINVPHGSISMDFGQYQLEELRGILVGKRYSDGGNSYLSIELDDDNLIVGNSVSGCGGDSETKFIIPCGRSVLNHIIALITEHCK